MEFLRRTIEQISQQLDVLSKSQKIAIGLCAALVAGSLFWLVHYSTAPEMIPVLRQNMSLDEIDAALGALSAEGIAAKQIGNRIMVRPNDQARAMMAMNRANALPTDTSVGFAELLADENPFRPADENKFRRRVALGTELGRILTQGDPSLEMARVVIQDTSTRRVGAVGNVKPTASVQIKLANGQVLDQVRVDGICRFVSGAVPGLEPHHVTVRDATTGRAFATADPEDAFGIGLLEEKKKNEKHLAEKIRDALQSIPGVLVSVSVDLDANKTTTQTQAWAKPEVKSEETTSSVNTAASTPAETGVNANVGVALSGAGNGSRNETDESKTEFFDQKSTEVTSTQKIPFTITRATASVSVPRSHFVRIHQSRSGGTADPAKLDDDPEYQRIRDEEIARVRSRVSTILMTSAEQDISVVPYYDFGSDGVELNTTPGGPGGVMASTGGGVMDYASRYGIQAGLATLALFSFFLLARMVRKSSELIRTTLPPAARAHEEEEFEETLSVAGGPVGRAAATEGLLIGQEVDEETLRYTQLGEQVAKMVDTNPASAAELLRRWATTSE
jgi:flagellar biosynthesis/type III secretory pathway M-ring protein FliF/YscJ